MKMPANITTAELAILLASMVLFLILPGVLGWIEDWRQPRPSLPPEPEDDVRWLPTLTVHGSTPARPSVAEMPAAPPAPADVATSRDLHPGATVAAEPEPAPVTGGLSPVSTPVPAPPATMTAAPPSLAATAAPTAGYEAEPVVPEGRVAAALRPPEPPASPLLRKERGSDLVFRLDELRQACSLEQLPATIDCDSERGRLWQQGREWLQAHKRSLGDIQ
ncbi:MAG TPA: hypothetical protein VEB21_07725, partial [Terriglobales bacterium]|nr:hypothetical protein [Terriglobales bacterium]